MYDNEEHVEDLIGHVRRVQSNAMDLARHFMRNGRAEFARVLLAKVHLHDASKWGGIEWDWMHRGPDAAGKQLELAISQHQKTNDHHPEYWGGLKNMPEICVAEMVCDWLARSQEFATDLRVYIRTQAAERFDFAWAVAQAEWIWKFVGILLPEKFAKPSVPENL